MAPHTNSPQQQNQFMGMMSHNSQPVRSGSFGNVPLSPRQPPQMLAHPIQLPQAAPTTSTETWLAAKQPALLPTTMDTVLVDAQPSFTSQTLDLDMTVDLGLNDLGLAFEGLHQPSDDMDMSSMYSDTLHPSQSSDTSTSSNAGSAAPLVFGMAPYVPLSEVLVTRDSSPSANHPSLQRGTSAWKERKQVASQVAKLGAEQATELLHVVQGVCPTAVRTMAGDEYEVDFEQFSDKQLVSVEDFLKTHAPTSAPAPHPSTTATSTPSTKHRPASKSQHSPSTGRRRIRRRNVAKQCDSCNTTKTPVWRDCDDDKYFCNACGLRFNKMHYRCRNPECRYVPHHSDLGKPCPLCTRILD
eukprot:m.57057 g.57057  ORF g.57057 m.57057 type:complete len:356 (+) comp11585_c0_seq2:398-1465(+)